MLPVVILARLSHRDVDKNYLLGKFDPALDSRFVKPDDRYASGAAQRQFLRKEAYEAFVKMAEDAIKDNIELAIVSATRNFDAQKAIWERKWMKLSTIVSRIERAREILKYSAMPGTSRHHWGTDIDLNNLEDEYFLSGKGWEVYQWLTANAAKYGFCQPYTPKASGRAGYEEEKWHWSYTPLSTPLLRQYLNTVTLADITDFQGSEIAAELDVIKNYVAGVDCQ
ncbi:MAG: D-alanyl-D-alanine carboxypeptidase [Chloracidobacterium sp. CP2_5A]|nr:MAG: D-alanyl-D-alanine carboxypeptidase [Chloracidobacterium sp. CP2_5A]